MGCVELNIGDNYKLDGVITYFEAYMFVTTPKWIAEHTDVADGCVVDPDGNILPSGDWSDLAVRKKMLTAFNNVLKPQIFNFPKPDRVACIMIELFPNDISDDEMWAAICGIQEHFVEWCKANHRAGAFVPHIYQKDRVWHVHILHTMGKRNEFQDYLMTKLNLN